MQEITCPSHSHRQKAPKGSQGPQKEVYHVGSTLEFLLGCLFGVTASRAKRETSGHCICHTRGRRGQPPRGPPIATTSTGDPSHGTVVFSYAGRAASLDPDDPGFMACDLGAVQQGGRMPPHVGHERGQIRTWATAVSLWDQANGLPLGFESRPGTRRQLPDARAGVWLGRETRTPSEAMVRLPSAATLRGASQRLARQQDLLRRQEAFQ